MADIEFVIVKHLGALGEAGRGWAKELNLVSWNKREPKYDIRDWDPNHEKMGKGVTLSRSEAEKLLALLGTELAARENA